MEKTSEKKRFSIVARIKSSTHAWRGIGVFLKTTHNAWVEIALSLIVIYLGFILKISNTEWMVLVLTMGMVFAAEAINTAIEIDIDLTSPTYHPYARDTKDVAAGAVLMTAFMAVIIGLIIFLPKILVLIK